MSLPCSTFGVMHGVITSKQSNIKKKHKKVFFVNGDLHQITMVIVTHLIRNTGDLGSNPGTGIYFETQMTGEVAH